MEGGEEEEASAAAIATQWIMAAPTRAEIAFAGHCAHLVYLWRDGSDVPIDLDALAALPPTAEKDLQSPKWVSFKTLRRSLYVGQCFAILTSTSHRDLWTLLETLSLFSSACRESNSRSDLVARYRSSFHTCTQVHAILRILANRGETKTNPSFFLLPDSISPSSPGLRVGRSGQQAFDCFFPRNV